ncbi:unnamed protein product, partial [Prorocentrum cordatum]
MGGGASGGKGVAGQPPLPTGPVPNLSLAEAKQLSELSQKAGDLVTFKRYSDLVKHLENAQKPPPAVSPQAKLQQADSAVKKLEKKLEADLARMLRLQNDLEGATTKMHETKSALAKADQDYKNALAECNESAKIGSPSNVSLAQFTPTPLGDLVEGKVDINSFFSCDLLDELSLEYEVTETDRMEFEKRKESLRDGVQKLASDLFKQVVNAAQDAKNVHVLQAVLSLLVRQMKVKFKVHALQLRVLQPLQPPPKQMVIGTLVRYPFHLTANRMRRWRSLLGKSQMGGTCVSGPPRHWQRRSRRRRLLQLPRQASTLFSLGQRVLASNFLAFKDYADRKSVINSKSHLSGIAQAPPTLTSPFPVGSATGSGSGGFEVFEGGVSVATANLNSWGTLKSYLESSDASVILGQEHRLLDPDAIAQASSSALKLGWKSTWCPGIPGEGGGVSSGTAIFARDGFGMFAASTTVVVPGRAVAAMVHAPGCEAICMVSIYLIHSEGLSEGNLKILSTVGEFLASLTCEFVLGGDWNLTPDTLEDSEFDLLLSSQIVFPSSRTCFPSKGKASVFDFFLVSRALAKGTKSIQEGDWSGALEVARRGYEAVLNDDFSLAVSTLDAGYSSWARSAERDLANIMGVELGVQGARSKSPQMYWKPVLRPAGRARDAHGKPIYWLRAQLHALVCYCQDWTVNACNASGILKSLADPDAA